MAGHKSLHSWLETHAAVAPDRVILSSSAGYTTRASLAESSRALASWLVREGGLRHGDRIAWLGHNHIEQIELVLAAALAGLVLVPLNWRLSGVEQRRILTDAGVSLLVAHQAFADRAREVVPPGCTLVPCGSDGEEASATFRQIVHEGATLPSPERTGTPEDALLLVYTSGTTGDPKGAILTQEAVLYNALNSIHMHGMTEDDTILTVLPMFHVGGLNIQTLPALYCGAHVILHATFDPGAVLAEIRRSRPTLLLQVPATLSALMAQPDWAETDISSLRSVSIGSTDVPVELIEAVHARGVPVIQIYGSTETGPVAIYQRAEEAFETAGALGRQGLHTEIRLVDADGNDVAPGGTGEILVRGPHVAQGYWGDPDNPAFSGGWFRSGDMARRDERGLYWFRGRRKHMIISGGENIYPAEIERVLRRLPGIVECAVVGVPDPKWGESPAALIVTEDGKPLPEAALRALMEQELARYKHPRHILLADALPRNVMGKVVPELVRDMILARLASSDAS